MGTLALTLNGSATGAIPGSPSNGDRIAMGNGTIRFSFVWGTTHTGTQWAPDLVEWWNGSAWVNVLYSKDGCRMALTGTEHAATNGALSIITNTASTLTLQLQASLVSGNTYTFTNQYTMTSSQVNLEVAQFLASSAQAALGSGQFVEDFGASWLTPGLASSVSAFFNGILEPSATGGRTVQGCFSGNTANARSFVQHVNSQRGFGYGVSILLANGLQCTWVTKPSSMQNLMENVVDPNTTTPQCGTDWQWAARGFVNFFPGTDTAYLTQTADKTPYFVRPGSRFGVGGSATTFPQSASNTDATTTLNFVWSLVIEQATGSSATGLAAPRYLLPQAVNRWIDTLYPRPNVGGSGILGGGSGPMWQSLATLENTITPLLASTYTAAFDTTYGYWQGDGSTTTRHSYANALALQTVLRWNNLGVGNADALTMADQLAVCIANYQQQSGVQTGAFYKIRDTSGNKFVCQEGTHLASADQPHVSMYAIAEILVALIEYYRVRGNRTLGATYGNITVATLLDQAMAFLVKVQQADGGFLVEYNNANIATATNAKTGASFPGSATVDLAASMYRWAQLSPTASAASIASWQQMAIRAVQYYMSSESVAHGNFEYGEGYTFHSHHGVKQLVRGFARWYRMTGAPIYQEWMAYYFEYGILLCKRIDEVINNSATNNQDVHTGGLMSTLSWNGVVSGEGASGWHMLMSEYAMLAPSLLAHDYFYMWANLAHTTWGFRDAATYLTSYAMSPAYMSPKTTWAAANGIDNTRFLYTAIGCALLLLATHTLVACDNNNVLAICPEATFATETPAGRTVLLHNPQGTSQAVNLTVRGQSGKSVLQDGAVIAGTKSGSDLLVALTLTSGQSSKVVVR